MPLMLLGLFGMLGEAQAQDADTFEFAGSNFDRRGSLQLAHPVLGASGSFYAGLGLVYAHNPVVIRYEDGSEEPVVSRQFSTRLAGGYTIGDVVRIDVSVPIYPSVVVNDVAEFTLGDISLAALIPVWSGGDATSGYSFGVKPRIDLPTGSVEAFTGQGGVGGGLVLAFGGYANQINYRVNAGVNLAKKVELDDLGLGSNIALGGGLDYRITDEWLVGAEVTSKIDIADGTAWNENPTEGHVYGGFWHPSGFTTHLGVGTGIIAGIGAPDVRVVWGVGFRKPDIFDTDGDGILDENDRCVNEPEDMDGFEDGDGCPDTDNDMDGLLDGADQCPNDPEDMDGFEDDNGCPDPDNDGDGILDGNDECPNEPGTQATNGCPDTDGDGLADAEDECPTEAGPLETNGCPDSDGDRVPDKRDECPNEPIPPQADPARSNGCPSRVIVTADAIEILDMVYFNTGKASIKSVSYPLLDDVATVLINNPDLTLIEVAGHTDSQGKNKSNLDLSQRRAESVKTYLVSKGVDAKRLSPKGYGEEKPTDTNDTADGRANNRRVEFTIQERDE
ncbi:MAG: outer membrane protein OmpA-like peptidoglycan-associated protein [Cognaticolwellia sp.]|jgi:outer membrane protein OmpA-like peptidoglycan-associated protein